MGIQQNKKSGFLRDGRGVLRQADIPEESGIRDNETLKMEIDGDELEQNIKKVLKKMNINFQNIILHLLQGYSAGGLAGLFNSIPRGTLDNMLFRCREKLKQLLEEGGYL